MEQRHGSKKSRPHQIVSGKHLVHVLADSLQCCRCYHWYKLTGVSDVAVHTLVCCGLEMCGEVSVQMLPPRALTAPGRWVTVQETEDNKRPAHDGACVCVSLVLPSLALQWQL